MYRILNTSKTALFTTILAGLVFFTVACFGQNTGPLVVFTYNKTPDWVLISNACHDAELSMNKLKASLHSKDSLYFGCGSTLNADSLWDNLLDSSDTHNPVQFLIGHIDNDVTIKPSPTSKGHLYHNVVKFGPHKYVLSWSLDFDGDTFFDCDPKSEITVLEPININNGVVAGNGCTFTAKALGKPDVVVLLGEHPNDTPPVRWVKEPLTHLVPQCEPGYEPWRHVPASTPAAFTISPAVYFVPQAVSAHDEKYVDTPETPPSDYFCAPVGYNSPAPVSTPVYDFGTVVNATTTASQVENVSTSLTTTTAPEQ